MVIKEDILIMLLSLSGRYRKKGFGEIVLDIE